MKSTIKSFAVVAAFAAVSVYGAEVINLTNKDFWRPNKNIQFADGKMSHKGRLQFTSRKPIVIDHTKKYTLKATVSASGSNKVVQMYFGFSPASDMKKAYQCPPHSLQTIDGTFTTVAADVLKGDNVIKIKDGSKWKLNWNRTMLALNAKADLSDLPNWNVTPAVPISVVKEGDVWSVTFKKPIKKAIKAGTNVRQHISGGGYLYLTAPRVSPGKSVAIQKSITGTSKNGVYNAAKGFPYGMKYGYIIILSDWYGAKADIEIKDATLTIE